MDLVNLPDQAQKELMLLALIENNLVDCDNSLKYSKIPIYILKPNENFDETIQKHSFKIIDYLIKSKYILPFSFSDDSINQFGFKPIYFLLSEDYSKIDAREKTIIKLINLNKNLNYLFN